METIKNKLNKNNEAPPLVTLALFAYNQEKFIREAVDSVLNQEYSNLEIILSDDCSTDSTFEIINSIVSAYSGPHKIIINKNPVNLGLTKHFSEIVSRSRGEIIVVAAGDDISLPLRVSKTVDIFSTNPEATIVSFTDVVIDEFGTKLNKSKKQAQKKIRKSILEDYISGCAPHLSGASRGFKKKIFDIFGELNEACPTEDTPCILRGLMIGYGLVSPECGIYYRQHDNNLSGVASLHFMRFEEIKKQYLKDAKYAFSTGLIINDTMRHIANWAEKNYRRRKLASDFYKDTEKLNFFFRIVASNKDFKFHEKTKMFFKSIF